MLMFQALDQIEYHFDYLPFEGQRQPAFDYYCQAMSTAGFDLSRDDLLELIEHRIWMEWGTQTGYFRQLEAERQEQLQYERALEDYHRQQIEPARGSAAHMRADAIETYNRTGVWGLNCYGGHILSEQEQRNLGL